MKIQSKNDTILEATLANASKLKVSDNKLEDMMREDRTRSTISNLCGKDGKAKVISLYRSSENLTLPRCEHYDKMPYHPLPNAIVYGKPKEAFNGIAAIFGEMEREKKQQTVILNGRNNKANSYIKYRFNNLGHYRDQNNPEEYGRQGVSLLRNKVFQMMALNHVCAGFATNLSDNERKRIMNALNEIIEHNKITIPMKRVYIEKSNGKGRPLGVPEVSGRIYLHMGNCLIVGGRTGKDNNHAFFPGKGTHTAGQDILEKVKESKDIFEFDLTSFFPSVNLNALEELMVTKLSIPIGVASRLIEMNRSITVLPKETKLPEINDQNVLLQPTNTVNPNLPPSLKKAVSDIMNSDRSYKLEALHSLLPEGGTIYREIGVPQGTATSCGIATISLFYVGELLGRDLVMYADDGVLFPSNPEDIAKLEDKARGPSVNLEKSSGVKKDSNGKKDGLKFLGLKLEIVKGTIATISAATRKGSDLKFTKGAQFATFVKSEGEKLIKETYSIKEIMLLSGKARYNSTQTIEEYMKAIGNPNPLSSLPDQTVSEGIIAKWKKFENMSTLERLSLLFTKTGLSMLSQIYNGAWGSIDYKDIKQHVVGSGLHIHGPRVMYEDLLGDWGERHLTIEYGRRALRANLQKYLPETPHSIGRDDWASLITDPRAQERAHELQTRMLTKAELLEENEGPEFEKALNSLFKGNNKSVETSGKNVDLRDSLRSLLQGYPLNGNSINTLATADILSERDSDERSIRRCTCTKTKSILVKRKQRNHVVEKKNNYRKVKGFIEQYKLQAKSLTKILEID